MVKSVAEKHGLRATFMPKPFKGLTGNGCHAHISVWDSDGKVNAFADTAMPFGLSAQGQDLPWRHHEACLRACRDHQSDGQFLQAHQCAADRLGRDLGAEHASPGPATTAPTWCAFRVPAASSCACRTARRTPTCCRRSSSPRASPASQQGRSRPAPRHRHVSRRPYDHRRAEAAAEPARRAARIRSRHRPARGARQRVLRSLPEAQAPEWNAYCAQFTAWEHETTLDV